VLKKLLDVIASFVQDFVDLKDFSENVLDPIFVFFHS